MSVKIGPRSRFTVDGIDLRGRVPAVFKRWVRSHDGPGLVRRPPPRIEFRDGAGALDA